MIQFKYLKRACDKLDFKLISRNIYLCVYDEVDHMLIRIFPCDPWKVDFTNDFNLCFEDTKEMLIKAITKDYEEFNYG